MLEASGDPCRLPLRLCLLQGMCWRLPSYYLNSPWFMAIRMTFALHLGPHSPSRRATNEDPGARLSFMNVDTRFLRNAGCECLPDREPTNCNRKWQANHSPRSSKVLKMASSGFLIAERMFSATFSMSLVPQKGSVTS